VASAADWTPQKCNLIPLWIFFCLFAFSYHPVLLTPLFCSSFAPRSRGAAFSDFERVIILAFGAEGL
jgi:hypothetical protein